MTPAERVAELRRLWEGGHHYAWVRATDRVIDNLLALAEAVPAALEGKTDALAAAWAALGDA